jgi:hypothetical protein
MGAENKKNVSQILKVVFIFAAFVLVFIVLLTLIYYYNTAGVNWTKTKDVFDVVKNFATILGVIVGAIWAYFNFFKGRTYKPRLEPKVSGKIISKNETFYLIITVQLKNVGLSDVDIIQKGTALRVFSYLPSGTDKSVTSTIKQNRVVTLSVFEKHGWVEPGELIEEQNIVALPKDESVAFQINLRIVSNGIEWNSVAIIEAPEQKTGNLSNSLSLEGTDWQLVLQKTPRVEDQPGEDAATGNGQLEHLTESSENRAESRKIENEKKDIV